MARYRTMPASGHTQQQQEQEMGGTAGEDDISEEEEQLEDVLRKYRTGSAAAGVGSAGGKGQSHQMQKGAALLDLGYIHLS